MPEFQLITVEMRFKTDQDPQQLAQMTTQVHEQQPDLLQKLMSLTGGNSAIKGGLAGIAANAVSKLVGR